MILKNKKGSNLSYHHTQYKYNLSLSLNQGVVIHGSSNNRIIEYSFE